MNLIFQLQERVIHLENQTKNFNDVVKYALRGQNKAPQAIKSIPQVDLKKGSNLTNSDQSFENVREMESKTLSEGPRIDEKATFESQQDNIPAKQRLNQDRSNFITLGRISEDEQIEIIQTRSLRRMNVVNRISPQSRRNNIFEEIL